MRGITKAFNGVRVLDEVDFELREARFTRWWAATAPASRR